jgi:hypothetical protein
MIDSVSKYRIFDLVLLAVLAVFCEVIGELLHIRYAGAGFYLSFSILIAIISMIRWGYWGTLVYVIAGIPMVFIHDGSLVENLLLYPFSYMFLGLANIFFIFVKRSKIKESAMLILCFTIIAYISVSIGKGISTYILTGVFLNGLLYYNVIQLFSFVMVFIVLLLIRNSKGLLVDMEQYLIEVNTEK